MLSAYLPPVKFFLMDLFSLTPHLSPLYSHPLAYANGYLFSVLNTSVGKIAKVEELIEVLFVLIPSAL